MRTLQLACCAAALAALASSVLAQNGTETRRVITGSVEDRDTREPIAGAVVAVAGTELRTSTDDQGYFVLVGAPAGALTLEVGAPGYAGGNATVAADRDSARIALASADPSGEAAAPEVPAAAGRTVRGRVTEEQTGEAIPGAVVSVVGGDQSAMADESGRFLLENAPPGALRISVSATSYRAREVAVPPGGGELGVALAFESEEQILITGRAPQIVRQNLANGASVVKGEDVSRVAADTVEDALTGKIAGANIQRNSGAPGGGVQVSLRGVSTIKGQSSPLYVVDGVIVSNVAIPSGISAVTESTKGSNSSNTQDNQVNRIADINPNDIESVEVLKGAAAAALYGSKASNGVIIITTRRGRKGAEPQVSVTQRLGLAQVANTLGSRRFETVEEAVETFGEQARNLYMEGRRFDHEKQLFGQTELATETIASVSGGLKDTSYFGSFLVLDEPGTLVGTGYQKQSARLGITQELGDRLTLGFSTNLIHSEVSRGMTQNDNSGVSHYMVLPTVPEFFDLSRGPDGSFPANPFIGSRTNPLQTVALMRDSEEVWRVIGALNAGYKVFDREAHGLSLASTLGVDWFQQKNDLVFPPELFFESQDGLPGTSLDNKGENRNLNLNVSSSYRYSPPGASWKSVSTAGLLFEERKLDTLYIVSRNLNAGQDNVASGTNIEIAENRMLVRDRGGYLQEELLFLDEDLSVVVALLAEQSSANGATDTIYLYPKGQAAYKLPISEGSIDLLRVRASYGEAGNQPLYGQKFTPLDATSTFEGLPGISLVGIAGDPGIEPERQREVEAGVDLVGLGDRLVAEVSVYQKNVDNLLLERTPAPSTGFSTEFFNGGELRNRGIEAMLQVKPVETRHFSWLSRTIFTINRSRIMDLPVPAFMTGGFGPRYGSFRIEEGASATQIVGNNGLNEDGTCCKIEKIGDTEPDFRMSFVNNFTFRDWGLTSLWDWQQGSDVINLTRNIYDLTANSPDYEEHGMKRLADNETFARVYVEDATFLKLRELSLHYDVPESVVKLLGPMNSARVSVSGRNLLTFTRYSGLDPEVSNFGNQPIARNIDLGPYPPTRSYWFSVQATF